MLLMMLSWAKCNIREHQRHRLCCCCSEPNFKIVFNPTWKVAAGARRMKNGECGKQFAKRLVHFQALARTLPVYR